MTSILQLFGFGKPEPPTEDEDGLRIRRPNPQHEESYRPDQFFTAFRQGDYELALRAAEALKNKGKATADYCYYVGATLVQLARYTDAEKWLREYLEVETDMRVLARGYSVLAQLYIQTQRFDDAMSILSRGVERCPDKTVLHRDLAEASLRRGDDPAEALQLARLAASGRMPNPEDEDTELQIRMGGNLATLAWILAAAEGDEQEVDEIAQRAAKLVRGERIAACGQVFYHAGLAYATLGDRGRSMRCFEDAVLVDPKGLWGRGARMMAHGMSKG